MAKILGVLVAALVAWALTAAAALAEHGRWQQVENNPSCSVWNAYPNPSETVTWSGACVDGKVQGRGVAVWANGDRYEGEYRDGKRHGRGVYVTANGGRYEGEFRDGKFHGRGVMVGASGDRYEGDWKDGKEHGRGVLVFANGDRYEGDFRDDKANGSGTYLTRYGHSFSGYWTNGCFKRGEVRAWIGTSKEDCGFD